MPKISFSLHYLKKNIRRVYLFLRNEVDFLLRIPCYLKLCVCYTSRIGSKGRVVSAG
jgi:hypothetical protein